MKKLISFSFITERDKIEIMKEINKKLKEMYPELGDSISFHSKSLFDKR